MNGLVQTAERQVKASGTVAARAAAIIDWLINGERLKPGRMAPLLERYAAHLLEAGLPLGRLSLHIRQLHPQLAARSLVWSVDSGTATELGHEHSAQHTPSYRTSPVKQIFEGGPMLRRRLADPHCPMDFPILTEFRDAGLTDYAILPIVISGGQSNAISIATRNPDGFSEDDLALLDATLPTFAVILELQHLRRTARDLLSTYVGPNTGDLIFSGAVRRGDGQVIHAVLWYCDLRGFTALSECLPLPDVIARLNQSFDRMAQAVVANGGEILKFIGDAMLAIFPCEAGADSVCAAADSAIAAAEAAVEGIAAMNQEEGAAGGPLLHSGIAIHAGEVMYGNVGAADRLDFTVIGPAVNMVTRMEGVCAQLDVPIVISKHVAKASKRKFRPLGSHAFKGIARKHAMFTLA